MKPPTRFLDGGRSAGIAGVGLALVLGMAALPAHAVPINVTVTDTAPANGVYLTPAFVAFHDGSFDLYDRGQAVASNDLPGGLESVAEDGVNAPLEADFAASSAAASGGVAATIESANGPFAQFPTATVGNVFGPGGSGRMMFDLDPDSNRYFSFASMVIPSNDAFIGNDDPLAYELFDSNGDFTGSLDLTILGTSVLDAGTEQNTETDAAFLNQAMVNTGLDEGGVVATHPGFNGSERNPDGTPVNILGNSNPLGVAFGATAADFTGDGYQVARIRISQGAQSVPEPSGAALMALAVLGLGLGLRLRRQNAAIRKI